MGVVTRIILSGKVQGVVWVNIQCWRMNCIIFIIVIWIYHSEDSPKDIFSNIQYAHIWPITLSPWYIRFITGCSSNLVSFSQLYFIAPGFEFTKRVKYEYIVAFCLFRPFLSMCSLFKLIKLRRKIIQMVLSHIQWFQISSIQFYL